MHYKDIAIMVSLFNAPVGSLVEYENMTCSASCRQYVVLIDEARRCFYKRIFRVSNLGCEVGLRNYVKLQILEL